MEPIIIVVFIAGLFLGTLLNVVIARLPREHELNGWPRCTRCGRPLAWWQLLPIVGWLAQGGRGRCCGRRLHWLFPLVELLAAAALARFYVLYGASGVFFYLAFVAGGVVLGRARCRVHPPRYILILPPGTPGALLGSPPRPPPLHTR